MATTAYCAKTDEAIELLFGLPSVVGQKNRALDGRAHWHHLANTVARLRAAAISGSAAKGGDAACSQITLGDLVIAMSHHSTMYCKMQPIDRLCAIIPPRYVTKPTRPCIPPGWLNRVPALIGWGKGENVTSCRVAGNTV